MAIPGTRLGSFLKRRPRRPRGCRFTLSCFQILVSFFLLPLHPSWGLQISSTSRSPTYAAVGESVTLHLHFSLAPEDSGVLDIEWSVKPADTSQEQKTVIWYAGNRIYDNFDQYVGRVHFVSHNPASGNASITINNLTMTDTNIYECKVRKLPGIMSSLIHLDVMERPNKPECHVEGVVELSREVVLRCRATRGSPTIWYRWSMAGAGKRLPYHPTFEPTQGDLILTITDEVAPGAVVCTAQNLVGMNSCLVTLRLKNSEAVKISAAVVAPVVFIVTVAIIVFCCRRRKVDNSGHEISVYELPPYNWLPKNSPQVVSSKITQDVNVEEVKFKAQNLENEELSVEMNDMYVEMPLRRTCVKK